MIPVRYFMFFGETDWTKRSDSEVCFLFPQVKKPRAVNNRAKEGFTETLLSVTSGFLCGNMVPEKDGVSSAVVVAEMATYLHNKNLSLNQQLHNIYQTYAACLEIFRFHCSGCPSGLQAWRCPVIKVLLHLQH